MLIIDVLLLCCASGQDIDCFYAQSEVLRCPSLRGRPVGVTQKFLVVTTNYIARSLGVPKMVSIDEAKKVLPALVLVNGEDLTPYRAESKQIMAVLGRYGVVQRSHYFSIEQPVVPSLFHVVLQTVSVYIT